MEQKIQVLLRTFEGDYRYPNGLLTDAATYIDSLEKRIAELEAKLVPDVEKDVRGNVIMRGE